MHLKVKQSVYMLFDPRFNATCARLTTLAATNLHRMTFAVISAFTFQAVELLIVILTILKLGFTAHLMQLTVVLVSLLLLK